MPLPESVSLALAAHLAEFPARAVTLPWMEPDGKPRTETLIFTTSRGVIHRSGFNPTSGHRPGAALACRTAGRTGCTR